MDITDSQSHSTVKVKAKCGHDSNPVRSQEAGFPFTTYAFKLDYQFHFFPFAQLFD